MLSVSLLGDFCIRRDETLVTDLDAPRLQSLLAYLLLHREAPQSRAHLAFLFWPDTTEAQARTNLRYVLHHLRRVLPNADAHLDTRVQTVQWRSEEPFTLDVADFDAALTSADLAEQQGSTTTARDALEQAVALYKGDLLPSCYDDWILPDRERLRQVYLHALDRLGRIQEDQHEYQAAILSAQRLLRHDPLHEATYRHLMRLHALEGNRAGALRVYHTCATVLQRELEVDPGAATRELYEQLLAKETGASQPTPATAASPPLVGRTQEWMQMQRAWRTTAAGQGAHVVMLSGEAGIGKTRLVEDLLQWAGRQGIATAHARCYAAEGRLAYAPVTAWLRAHPRVSLEDIWLAEVARLLPEILAERPLLPRLGPMTEAWQRQHLFEALSRAILGIAQPLLLAIDDLQWCDGDTLEWLHFLLRFDSQARVLVAGTYRSEEVGDEHPLVPFLQELRQHAQVTEVELGPLDEAASYALASQIAGVEIDAGSAQLLYRETEGNPLFVVETVRAGLPSSDREADMGPREILPAGSLSALVGLPQRVLTVLETRLAQLSPPARDLAGVAATIGREFSLPVLAMASRRDEESLVRELDELWGRRIVREHGTDAYDFSHDKLREVAYWRMSAVRRQVLHHRVASALEARHAADLDPVSHQLAAHYERAGLPEQAVPYYGRAADVERRVHANGEALSLLRRGLTVLRGAGLDTETGSRPLAARLWEGVGDLLELNADHEEALRAFQKALEAFEGTDRISRARLHRKRGAVQRQQRLYAEALDACYQAEAALGRQPGDDAAAWWTEWIEVQVEQVWAHYWLAQWPEMEALVKKIRPVVQERASATMQVAFLRACGLMDMRKHRYRVLDEMLADASEALDASRQSGSLADIAECEFVFGFLNLWRRALDTAGEHLQVALGTAERCGNAWIRTLSLSYLTVLQRFRGLEDEVLACAQRAREVAEASHMPAYVAAAQGNYAWLAWRRGDLDAAEQTARRALAVWQASPLVYPFQWQGLWPLLGVALRRGLEDEACGIIRALLDPEQQRLSEPLNAALEAALQASSADQPGATRPYLDQVVALARAMGYL